ncbi:hypothetical protein SEA_PHINKY_91 [Microbacterium phage Phinky]|nr:hypothetical protein SEA_PHINKY_91 [Microbacterium phage Phinky]
MTDQIPMRSASERRDAATKALSELRAGVDGPFGADSGLDSYTLAAVSALVDRIEPALKALLEVPEVGEDEEDLIRSFDSTVFDNRDEVLRAGIRLGERMGLEHWEPADIPSQEFMLRHLGIEHEEYDDAGPMLSIPQQYIEKEVI